MKKYLLFIIGLSFILSSCNSSSVFKDRKTFSDLVWKKQDKVVFNFEIKKEAKYNIFLDCRYIDGYPYNIMKLNYNIVGNKNKKYKSLIFAIKDKNGLYIGDQMGDFIDFSRTIVKDTLLPIGTYQISIEENTSPKSLAFVMEMGIHIDKIEK